MACATANVKFRLRRATASEWLTRVLLDGEPGFDTTNNILKIGNGGKTWSQLQRVNFDLFGIPLAPTNLVEQSFTTVSKTYSWNYPLQTQTGFSSSKLPLIIQFNAKITHAGGTITLPAMPAATRNLTLNLSSGSSGPSGTAYTYYDPIFQSVLTNPILTIWYTNFSSEPPNEASITVQPFTLPHGAPSAVRDINVNPIRNHLVITYSPPAQNNILVPGDPIGLDKYDILIRREGVNVRTAQVTTTYYDYTFGTLSGTYSLTIFATNLYPDESGFISTTVPAPTVIANHNTTILENATLLSVLPYTYISGPAANDLIYYRGKFRTYTALDSTWRSLITEGDNTKYTTFAFTISQSILSGLNIIVRNVEGGISYVNAATSSAISVGGRMPGVYYRFVSGSGTGPDYSSRWISANTTEGQDVSSSEYNNPTVSMYNGLITSSFSSDITFNVFAPNIVYNPAKTTTLFVTIQTFVAQNMSFSRVDYN